MTIKGKGRVLKVVGNYNSWTTLDYNFLRGSNAMQLTGVFTAPISGDYQFNFQGRVSVHFFLGYLYN